jgi:hypothetical protein
MIGAGAGDMTRHAGRYGAGHGVGHGISRAREMAHDIYLLLWGESIY